VAGLWWFYAGVVLVLCRRCGGVVAALWDFLFSFFDDG
jgi:hypothetical protein